MNKLTSNNKIITLIVGILLAPTTLYAADEAAKTDSNPEKAISTAEATPEATAIPTTTPKTTATTTPITTAETTAAQTTDEKADQAETAKKVATKRRNTGFIPTESISEDLAVSFPVDI